MPPSFRPLAAIVLVACSTRLLAPELPDHHETVRIYLLDYGFHSGLVFELRWLEENGYRKPEGIGDHRFVAMSWGDETAYLQERWLTPAEVYRALFTRTRSVMECIPFDRKVEEVFPRQRVYVAEIAKTSGRALAEFLNAHSECDDDGNPVTIAPSSWGGGYLIRCPSRFPYHLSHMCNNWTGEALVAAGLTIDSDRVVAAWDVIRSATSEDNGFRLVRRSVAMDRGTVANSPHPSDRGSCR